MTARRKNERSHPQKQSTPKGSSKAAGKQPDHASENLPETVMRSNTGQPRSGEGRIDVTGIMPEGIRVDPDITEGHPGYQESGDSEIIPNERLREGEPDQQKRPRR